jgi:diguanylate cyclase (GGDEF)-like protein
MKVLITNHQEGARHLLEQILRRWGYEVILAKDVNQVWSTLYAPDAPRLIILDWLLPGVNGTELCQRLRERQGDDYVYVLLTTLADNPQDIAEGLAAGADDYITEPFDARELRARLRVAQRILSLQSTLRQTQRQTLRHPVTNLWNGAVVPDILGREISRARREAISLSLLLVRIDEMAHMEQTYDADAYQQLWGEIASRIRGTTRGYDTVAHYGEHDLLIILPGCDKARAAVVAERVERVLDREPYAIGEEGTFIRSTVGYVTLRPHDALQAEGLLRAAERSLRDALIPRGRT